MEEQLLRLREMGPMINDQEARNCLYNQLETVRGLERATKQKVSLRQVLEDYFNDLMLFYNILNPYNYLNNIAH